MVWHRATPVVAYFRSPWPAPLRSRGANEFEEDLEQGSQDLDIIKEAAERPPVCAASDGRPKA
jgi:hypothetical protein